MNNQKNNTTNNTNKRNKEMKKQQTTQEEYKKLIEIMGEVNLDIAKTNYHQHIDVYKEIGGNDVCDLFDEVLGFGFGVLKRKHYNKDTLILVNECFFDSQEHMDKFIKAVDQYFLENFNSHIYVSKKLYKDNYAGGEIVEDYQPWYWVAVEVNKKDLKRKLKEFHSILLGEVA